MIQRTKPHSEAVFSDLSEEAALVARRCVILHWFDQSIAQALLQDAQLTESELQDVYEQLM
jgi:hypothetical protein